MSFMPLNANAPKPSTRKSTIFATLDVGASKVVCLIARVTPEASARGPGKFIYRRRVLGIGHQKSRGVKAGAVVDLDAVEKSIRLAVDAAERMAGVEAHKIIVNLSGGRLASRRSVAEIAVPGRAVTQADVRAALGAAASDPTAKGRSLLHVMPLNFKVDATSGVRDPVGMLGERFSADATLVTCDSAVARNLMLAVERCHLQTSALVASPYAAGLAALSGDEAELGAAVIDFGGGTTTVGVFAGSKLVHADAVAVGGIHVTMDVARGLSVSLADAERLKSLHGACLELPSDERETFSVQRLGEDFGRDFARPPGGSGPHCPPARRGDFGAGPGPSQSGRLLRAGRAAPDPDRGREPIDRPDGTGAANHLKPGALRRALRDRRNARIGPQSVLRRLGRVGDVSGSGGRGIFARLGRLVLPSRAAKELRPARRALDQREFLAGSLTKNRLAPRKPEPMTANKRGTP